MPDFGFEVTVQVTAVMLRINIRYQDRNIFLHGLILVVPGNFFGRFIEKLDNDRIF